MKKLFKLLLLSIVLVATLASGCKRTKYIFYTNAASDEYSIVDKNFSAGKRIGGFIGDNQNQPFVPFENYSSKSFDYYQMCADSKAIISDNFERTGAEDKFNAFREEVKSVLDGINAAISSTAEGSDIYKFNQGAGGEWVEIGAITYEVLSLAINIYTLTDGYYNPALYYNIQAYGFGGAETYPQTAKELPRDEVIKQYTDLAYKFNQIELKSDEDGKYYAKKPDYSVEVDGATLYMKLDLGGIGKGYAVDKIDELFEKYDYRCGIFNFGASSMLLKTHFRAGDYSLGIINPRSIARDSYITVPVRNQKISSSGDNEQFYEIDGTRYCHIISPTTGKPVQTGIMSVTIIGGGAAEADALTTAIICMGKDKAISFIEQKMTDKKVIFTVG